MVAGCCQIPARRDQLLRLRAGLEPAAGVQYAALNVEVILVLPDMPMRQTQFEVACIGRDLARTPGFARTRGLQVYRAARLAGEAAA